MIKGIMQSGKYVHVTGGYPTAPSMNYNTQNRQTSNQSAAGDVRYNSTVQGLEIFDGYTWMSWNPSYASVGLSPEAEELLDWAKEKRKKELEVEKLAEVSPAVQDLVSQIKEKQDQLEMVTTLLKSPETLS
jgi:FAD synthase